MPKRCHNCKSADHLIEDCPTLPPEKKREKEKERAAAAAAAASSATSKPASTAAEAAVKTSSKGRLGLILQNMIDLEQI